MARRRSSHPVDVVPLGFAASGDRRLKNASPRSCRLVPFEAADGVSLSGMLFEPRRSTDRIAIFLHGAGGSSFFAASRTNLLAEELLDRRIAWFPFDNRGASVMRRLRARRKTMRGGMAYELIRDCIPDIDGAIRLVRRLGYRDVTLVGHSTGANKIAVYDFYKERNFARRYILLAGGDDTGLMLEQLGSRRFKTVLARARQLRRSEDLVPSTISPSPMSWRSLYDTINPDGDYNVFPFLEAVGRAKLSRRPLFRHLRGVRKPTLFVYGENDEYCYGDVSGAVEAMTNALGPTPNFEFVIMKNADHGFGGYEGELGALMADWIVTSS